MISKRKLVKWRKEALQHRKKYGKLVSSNQQKQVDRVLELTQILIDHHLLNETKENK